jgi:uncharacterized protein YdeI (YjbR/CyaY-like superfamily)
MTSRFFRTPAAFRAWLAKNHAAKSELLVGFHKRDSGKPSITWPESVDEALCFGWIDGVPKRIDETSYTIRFSPRSATSIWSAINIRRAQALIEEGRMRAEGRRAFEARRENKSGICSHEQRKVDLEPPYDRLLRKHKPAWEFFRAQPPWYRKAISWWILSAKREETRLKRMARLVEFSAKGKRLI